MSLHFSIGFVVLPRPATPAQSLAVTLPGTQSFDVVWPRQRRDFDPVDRTSPETEG